MFGASSFPGAVTSCLRWVCCHWPFARCYPSRADGRQCCQPCRLVPTSSSPTERHWLANAPFPTSLSKCLSSMGCLRGRNDGLPALVLHYGQAHGGAGGGLPTQARLTSRAARSTTVALEPSNRTLCTRHNKPIAHHKTRHTGTLAQYTKTLRVVETLRVCPYSSPHLSIRTPRA